MLGEQDWRNLVDLAYIWNCKWLVEANGLLYNICIFIFEFWVLILICVFHSWWFWNLVGWHHRLLFFASYLTFRCINWVIHLIAMRIIAFKRLIFSEFIFGSHVREIPVHFVLGLHNFYLSILCQMFQFNVGLLLICITTACHLLRHFILFK